MCGAEGALARAKALRALQNTAPPLRSGPPRLAEVLQSIFVDAHDENHSLTKANDPLKDAFLLLKKRAQDQGANALVEFQWKVAADGTRVFVSGLPLRVKRTGS